MTVVRQVVLTPNRLKQFRTLSEDAIRRALYTASARIREVAMIETPVWTGRLLGSFDIGVTHRSIVFKWSAKDPISGHDYAETVDKGRLGGTIITPKSKKALSFPMPWKGGPLMFAKRVKQGGFGARYYSEKVHQQAVDILAEELGNELAAIGG